MISEQQLDSARGKAEDTFYVIFIVCFSDGPQLLLKPAAGVVTPPATPPTSDQGSDQSHYTGPTAEINLRKPSLKHDIAR